MWKGKQCPNRSNGCRFAHSIPCSNNRYKSGPASGCRAFHPPVGKKDLPVSRKDTAKNGNCMGGVRMGGDTPKRKGNRSHKPTTGRTGGTSSGSRGDSNSSSSNRRSYNRHSNNNNSSRLQLRERMEMMERRLGLQGDNGGKMPSYRDMAARSLNSGNYPNPGRLANVGFARVQPDPTVLSTVVTAVMAVLGGGREFKFKFLGLNVSSLGRAGRELEVQLLLDRVRPVVVTLSETEVPADDDNVVFKNYKVFFSVPVLIKGY